MSDFDLDPDFDFEQRLRTTVTRRSESFDPSPDLPDRIDARVGHHRRRRQLVTGGLVSMAAATVAVVALVGLDRNDDDPIRMTDDDGSVVTRPDGTTTPSTPTPSTPTTTSPADTSTTSTTGAPPETPGFDPLSTFTSLSRSGIGPITAGMTLREVQEAAQVTVTPSAGGGATCAEALLDGFVSSPILVVEPSGADPLDGIVRAVGSSVLPSDEGAMVGQSRAELLASLGQPTRTEDASADIGFAGDLLVFEAGGYAYGALVVDDLVLGLQSGDPAWVSGADGCP